MARRKLVNKREKISDEVYGSFSVARFINIVMKDGKKSIARHIVYKALEELSAISKKDPILVFERALKNVMPSVQVKSKRIGGATFQVPSEVPLARSETLALKWILSSAKSRNERGTIKQLVAEMFDASGVADDDEGREGRGKGGAVRKKEETHKMAEANKAYVHYRW